MRLMRSLLFPLAVLACGGGTEPAELAGSYQLTAVDDSPLPYTFDPGGDCEQSIDTGELQLTEESYFIEFTGPLVCEDLDPAIAGRTYVGSYQVNGDRIHFETVLDGGALFEFDGETAGDGVQVTAPPIPPGGGPDLTLTFEPAP